MPTYSKQLERILRSAKSLVKQYRKLTGRPLGITGEIAECEAVSILRLQRSPVRQAGYDAIRFRNGKRCHLQIKARCILDPKKPGGRLPRIRLSKGWDAVLLVLLNADLEPVTRYCPAPPVHQRSPQRPATSSLPLL